MYKDPGWVQEMWYSCTFLSCFIGIIVVLFFGIPTNRAVFPARISLDEIFVGEDLLNHMAGANQQLEERSCEPFM